MINNILAVYAAAISNGHGMAANWYSEALQWATDTASRYGLPVWLVVYITAALSPLTRWSVNKDRVIILLESANLADSVGLKNSWRKAAAALQAWQHEGLVTSPETLGQKTRSFYYNIMGDNSYVTVDGHAANIANYGLVERRPALNNNMPGLTKNQYQAIADSYRKAADTVGISVVALQAITWEYWRTIKMAS